jgi:hypothetical protein
MNFSDRNRLHTTGARQCESITTLSLSENLGMAGTYFCASCGWKRRKKSDPHRCPDCGHPTQRYLTIQDALTSDLVKGVAVCVGLVLPYYVGSYLNQPYTDPQFQIDSTVRFHLSGVSLTDSPNGAIARLSLKNESPWEMGRVALSVRIHALAAGNEMGTMTVGGQMTITFENLGPQTEQVAEVLVEGRSASELFGFTASIESLQMPAGDKHLERGVSKRLVGCDGNVPCPFPQSSPIPQLGK